jgi:hypothetical protein
VTDSHLMISVVPTKKVAIMKLKILVTVRLLKVRSSSLARGWKGELKMMKLKRAFNLKLKMISFP